MVEKNAKNKKRPVRALEKQYKISLERCQNITELFASLRLHSGLWGDLPGSREKLGAKRP